MKVVIIEDELPAMNRMKKLVAEVSDAEVIGTADSIESATELFNNLANIDLALMDIELADGQSFEIFNRVQVSCPVIFTTAYDEYALKAFKVNSIDYLLKPVDKEELAKAIEKFHHVHKSRKEEGYEAHFTTLLQEIRAGREKYKSRFLIKSGTRLISVITEDIAYFQAADKVVYLVTSKGQRYIIDHTLDELNRMLNPSQFFHLNRQFVANVRSIAGIHTYFNGKLKVDMQPAPNEEVLVSRERAGEFKAWMDH